MTDKDRSFIDSLRRLDPMLADLMEEGDLGKVQTHARAQLAATAPPEGTPAIAEFGSPYAIICREHGRVQLTEDEYGRQLSRPDALWKCPKCGEEAQFDDDHYERMLGLDQPQE